jgi:general secretion pathway protein J
MLHSGRAKLSGRKESSFLKKRTKKLLSVAPRHRPKQGKSAPHARDKSFLVLFFKKELSFFLPPRTRQSAPDDGFTLLEILVAVVVLGFVIAGLSQATRFGITAWNVQEKLTVRADQMERVDRVLRLVIQQATPPLAADDKPFSGQEHRMVLITRLPDQPPTDPVRRAQVAVGVDNQHRLLLRWTLHPNAVALKPVPKPEEIVLADGVDHVDLMYRQALTDGGKWARVWDDSSLPALVQIHIVFQDQAMRWPTLQVATMLDTNGSF